jgi:hypothetical protein
MKAILNPNQDQEQTDEHLLENLGEEIINPLENSSHSSNNSRKKKPLMFTFGSKVNPRYTEEPEPRES